MNLLGFKALPFQKILSLPRETQHSGSRTGRSLTDTDPRRISTAASVRESWPHLENARSSVTRFFSALECLGFMAKNADPQPGQGYATIGQRYGKKHLCCSRSEAVQRFEECSHSYLEVSMPQFRFILRFISFAPFVLLPSSVNPSAMTQGGVL